MVFVSQIFNEMIDDAIFFVTAAAGGAAGQGAPSGSTSNPRRIVYQGASKNHPLEYSLKSTTTSYLFFLILEFSFNNKRDIKDL